MIKFISDIKVYTFGSFAVGNLKFATQYMKKIPRTVRVVNKNDLIPHYFHTITSLD